MGVSLQSYRIPIGLYNLTGRNNRFKMKKQEKSTSKSSLFTVLFLFFLLAHNPTSDQSINVRNSINSYRNSRTTVVITKKLACDTVNSPTTTFISWSHSVKTNALCHNLFGNRRRLSYKLALWNCRKGLLGDNNFDSSKLTEIKLFIQKHSPHTFAIVESNIHASYSHIKRRNTFNTNEIHSKLHIDGYKIELPDTWTHFGQARLLVYVREDVNYKRQKMPKDMDLPNVTLEIGLGREKKTLVNYFYREWTGGVSGEKSQASQINRLLRQISYWRTLYAQDRDVVCMGDANLCSLSWLDNDYEASKKVLANCVQEHLLEESSYQIVEDFTRSEMTRNGMSRSCIDHIYTNAPGKCDKPKVESAGDSDHLAVVVNKFTKEPQSKPRAVLKRSYKHFNPELFLLDVQNSAINEAVLACENINEAADVFQELFGHVLDRHAPRKIFQTRNNYVPFISEETKPSYGRKRCDKGRI